VSRGALADERDHRPVEFQVLGNVEARATVTLDERDRGAQADDLRYFGEGGGQEIGVQLPLKHRSKGRHGAWKWLRR
jgi:hypothetical protein